jgi:hypothetical protein
LAYGLGVEEKKKSLQHMYEEKLIPEEVYNKKLAEITDSLGPGIFLSFHSLFVLDFLLFLDAFALLTVRNSLCWFFSRSN